MSAKDNLTRLDDVELFDSAALAALRAVSITTVEDLLGSLQADPEGIARLIERDMSEIPALIEQARKALPLATLRVLGEVVPKPKFFGAGESKRD
jgi:hypothetical protein